VGILDNSVKKRVFVIQTRAKTRPRGIANEIQSRKTNAKITKQNMRTLSLITNICPSFTLLASSLHISYLFPEILKEESTRKPQRKRMATTVILNNTNMEPQCRACHSTALYTDWSQGDRICTSCGVVDEEHIMDRGPEWRDYQDDPDSTAQRSGMVPVNEDLYLGGLQPTLVSSYTFGDRNPSIRNRLASANHKIDYLMQKQHAKALSSAHLSHKIKRKHNTELSHQDVRPELEQLIVKEEDDGNRLRTAMYAEKWSLQRAIRWHEGHEDEQADKVLQKAAHDLYAAYSMLLESAEALDLNERVKQEASNLLCKYATLRDGLLVRGIAIARRKSATELVHEPNALKKWRLVPAQRQRVLEQAAKDSLNDYNKVKQHGALCAAILFLTARNLKQPRSLADVCNSIQPPKTMADTNSYLLNEDTFIKKRHCSRAFNEIKETFPEFAQAASSADGITTMEDPTGEDAIHNLIEHTLRKLHLPPVAETCVQFLMQFLDGSKEAKINIAAITLFVCHAGSTMQRLAQQSRQQSRSLPFSKKRTFSHTEKTTDEAESGLDFNQLEEEQRTYLMQRMWDAWNEQTEWARSLIEIENCCGVSSKLISEFYQTNLYPKRHELLLSLQDAVKIDGQSDFVSGGTPQRLTETPQSSILLTRLTAASPLMKPSSKL
jgi:transcription initiation factor TFIIIB Brf1 subunit/transcription initiation factor TFIIB